MDGFRMEHVLLSTPGISDCFVGFGSPDIPLQQTNKKRAVYILNTAVSSEPGEHWCVVCLEKTKSFFFDSYGQSPDEYNFENVVSKYKDIRYNTRPVQGVLAATCGHHCLYFCVKYGYGETPDDILNSYSSNLTANDNKVYRFIRENYGEVIARIRL
jgi:hypothetical protein